MMKKFLKGDVSLGISFWVYFFGINFLIRTIITLSNSGVDESFYKDPSLSEDILNLTIYALVMCYYFFSSVGTWRSATNYYQHKNKNNIGGGGWATLVQALITLGAINYIVVFSILLKVFFE